MWTSKDNTDIFVLNGLKDFREISIAMLRVLNYYMNHQAKIEFDRTLLLLLNQ